MPFQPIDLLSSEPPVSTKHVLGDVYTPVLAQEKCEFTVSMFEDVVLNILRNPNITSSHLFRADILYDSQGNGATDSKYPGLDVEDVRNATDVKQIPEFDSFSISRTLIRRLVPRNPQLDKPLEQTCHFLRSATVGSREKSLVICIPHTDSATDIPWYHPAVQEIVYLYDWDPTAERVVSDGENDIPGVVSSAKGQGMLSVCYRLFPTESLPLAKRLQRIAHHLLSAMYKHGQGAVTGYKKHYHHDLLLPQARVQDTYSALKQKHARRLCDSWVEVTDPSKHVFEDLAIAAFLIELWRDSYRQPEGSCSDLPSPPAGNKELPDFPGFVDIGCGNGVLTEILICEGYPGWGFDARRRKTWSILGDETKSRLRELILVPQPIQSTERVLLPVREYMPLAQVTSTTPKQSAFSAAMSTMSSLLSPRRSEGREMTASATHNDGDSRANSRWHNGLFPRGTFIISNHADELTAWTPLLASLCGSPFLAIPCCSHNLSGARFRAPSAYTGFTADASAPHYFIREKKEAAKSKHVAIKVPMSDEMAGLSNSAAAESGDLKAMSRAQRTKQTSAYSSLCDWAAFLADEVGFEVEKELMRIPSTRNLGIVVRRWADGTPLSSPEIKSRDQEGLLREIDPERWDTVLRIMEREATDGKAWIDRAQKLMSGNDAGKTVHG